MIETSRDGSNWEEVSGSGECRFIRLQQIGKNHFSSPGDQPVISGFEVFGTVIQV
jgi:hypothetical protein